MWRPYPEACTPSMSKAAGQDGRSWPAIKFIPLRLFAETWCFLVVTTARCTPWTTTRERKSGKLRPVLRLGLGKRSEGGCLILKRRRVGGGWWGGKRGQPSEPGTWGGESFPRRRR